VNGKPATLARVPAAPKVPPDLPAGACYACGGTRYWLTPGNAYECQTCHPEPARLRAEWEAGRLAVVAEREEVRA
jgi:hypothetical protein